MTKPYTTDEWAAVRAKQLMDTGMLTLVDRIDVLEAALRKHGIHVDCQWTVFPPGSRECDCGLHALIGVPDFNTSELVPPLTISPDGLQAPRR